MTDTKLAALLLVMPALDACGGTDLAELPRSGPIMDAGAGGHGNMTGQTSSGRQSSGGAKPMSTGGTPSRGGTGGTPSRSGTGGTPSRSGTGGAPGTGGRSAGGSGGELQCTVTDDRATIAVESLTSGDGGDVPDAAPPGRNLTRDEVFEGVVQKVSTGEFVVETCAPNDTCASAEKHVTISAPGLELQWTLGESSLVHVHFHQDCGFGCVETIAVTSLKTWGGLANRHFPPVGDFYVAADNGGGSLPEMAYTWDAVRLPCATSFEGGCSDPTEPAGIYALRFDKDFVVRMGETRTMPFSPGGLVLRNLRSYVSGYCDDYWNYGHWAMSQQLAD